MEVVDGGAGPRWSWEKCATGAFSGSLLGIGGGPITYFGGMIAGCVLGGVA